MIDPVQAHFAAALRRRLQTEPEAVQRVLQARQRAWPDRDAAPNETPARSPRAPSPLAQLNRDLAATAPPGNELRSAQGFRDSWSRLSAEDEVTQAVQHGPENAGPLNSHRLVLHTLAWMRDLSPDYLRRFLLQADALLWLEQAQSKAQALVKPPAAKPRSARTPK